MFSSLTAGQTSSFFPQTELPYGRSVLRYLRSQILLHSPPLVARKASMSCRTSRSSPQRGHR